MVTYNDVVSKTRFEGKWLDISTQAWREYQFPNGICVLVENPVALALSPRLNNLPVAYGGNSHRIVDAAGVSHYIPRGWVRLQWVGHDYQVCYDF